LIPNCLKNAFIQRRNVFLCGNGSSVTFSDPLRTGNSTKGHGGGYQTLCCFSEIMSGRKKKTEREKKNWELFLEGTHCPLAFRGQRTVWAGCGGQPLEVLEAFEQRQMWSQRPWS
jgi:hypothetical protein